MPDVFISYATADSRFGRELYEFLQAHDLNVFLAEISLNPGERWTDRIWQNLNASNWVIFLASRKACRSPFVLQELGGAISQSKKIIPVLWDMPPEELPGWLPRYQAIDLRGLSSVEVTQQVGKIAEDIRTSKIKTRWVAAGLLVIGTLAWMSDEAPS